MWLIIWIPDGTFAIRGNICVQWPSKWVARAELGVEGHLGIQVGGQSWAGVGESPGHPAGRPELGGGPRSGSPLPAPSAQPALAPALAPRARTRPALCHPRGPLSGPGSPGTGGGGARPGVTSGAPPPSPVPGGAPGSRGPILGFVMMEAHFLQQIFSSFYPQVYSNSWDSQHSE